TSTAPPSTFGIGLTCSVSCAGVIAVRDRIVSKLNQYRFILAPLPGLASRLLFGAGPGFRAGTAVPVSGPDGTVERIGPSRTLQSTGKGRATLNGGRAV